MVQYLKKIFRTEKIKKKIMTSFIVVIVLMSIGTTLGAITLFYTTRQYNAALENYGFSQGDIGKANDFLCGYAKCDQSWHRRR